MYTSIYFLFPLIFSSAGYSLSSQTSYVPWTSNISSSAVTLPKTIVSLSIETCYILDYLGDVQSPNKLSLRLLQNIQDLAGQPPIIRIGGHTQDVAKYCSTCTATLKNVFVPGNAEAANVTFNKSLFQVLNENVPSNQRIIFGLNLGQNNLAYPLAEVQAAEKYLNKSRLLSYELGNEPDFYGPSQRSPWNVQLYANQIVDWINKIADSTNTLRDWQVGALAQLPKWQGNFSLPELNTLGVPGAIKTLKSYSDHTYPYSICDPTRASQVSLPNLMNHSSTLFYFSQWKPSIAAAHAAGLAFNMGETGSVSCHGKAGVSNTMGAALWELDYVLNGAVLGMTGVYFHMGTPFYYSMWQPVKYGGVGPRVYPTYCTLLILATAISSLPDPYVASVPPPAKSPNLAIYALFTSRPALGPLSDTTPIGTTFASLPKALIILNLSYYSSNSTSPRPVQRLDVSDLLGTRSARVSRFTAPGADSIEETTFRGQEWLVGMGVPEGRKTWEMVINGVVEVGDSESLLVEVM